MEIVCMFLFVFEISEPKRLGINSVFIFIVPLSPVSDSPFYNVISPRPHRLSTADEFANVQIGAINTVS